MAYKAPNQTPCPTCGHPMHWHDAGHCKAGMGGLSTCTCIMSEAWLDLIDANRKIETLMIGGSPSLLNGTRILNSVRRLQDQLDHFREVAGGLAAVNADLTTKNRKLVAQNVELIDLAEEQKEKIAWYEKAGSTKPARLDTEWVTTEKPDDSDHKVIRGMWLLAQAVAIWSGTGFALGHTVDPAFNQMGIGVGIFVPVLALLAIATERTLNK